MRAIGGPAVCEKQGVPLTGLTVRAHGERVQENGTVCARGSSDTKWAAAIMSRRMYFLNLRSFLPGLAVALLLSMGVVAQADAKTQVERISFTPRADGQGFVVRFHVDGPVAAYSEPEKDGRHLKLILFNAALAPSYARTAPDGPVRDYSEELASGHVVFQFQLDPSRPVEASAYRDRGSDDILLGLTYAADAVAMDTAGDLPVPIRKASTASAPRASANDEVAWEQKPTESSSASSEGSQWLLDTVVIDAGHGGRDPGALAHGAREKDITLAVALKLGNYLKERLGVNVVYTRDDDRFIELKDRGRIANEHGSKLFISIHVNAARSSSAVGTETYFLGQHKSDAARNTMERENSVVRFESSQDEYEEMNEGALIRMELTQSAYMRKSQELSTLIQSQFEQRAQRKNRGVKQAGFYVLWGASMPAVLVELGFLTNRQEAAYLSSERGQDYMASAIYRAVREYKERYEKGLSQSSAD